MKKLVQKVNRKTRGVINPSNCADAASIPLAAWGSNRLDTWGGIAAAGVAFTVDWWDGPLARQLGTASPLGEKVDAVSDKIRLGYTLVKLIENDVRHREPMVPRLLLAGVGVQNLLNTGITIAERSVNKDNPQIHSSWAGKRAIFAQQWGIATHIIAAKLESDGHSSAKSLRKAGNVLGTAGIGLGAIATGGYAHTLWQSLQRRSDV